MIGKVDKESVEPANPALFLALPDNSDDKNNNDTLNIKDASISGLKEDSIGEMTMIEYEREIIEKYLKKFNDNRRKTAKALNISERTLYRKLKEYEI